MALTGLAAHGFITPLGNSIWGAGQRDLQLVRPGTVSFSQTQNQESIRGFVNGASALGTQIVTDVFAGETDSEVTVEFQSIDMAGIAFLMGEAPKVSASVTLATPKNAIVPADLSLEDAALTGQTEATVSVTVSGRGAWGEARVLNVVTGAPATIDEVQLNAATTQLIFFAGMVGAPIDYVINTTLTNKRTIGIEASPVIINTCEFVGRLILANRGQVWVRIQDIVFAESFEFSIAPDAPTFTKTGQLVARTGNRTAVQFIEV
jgi:hypothetical protein